MIRGILLTGLAFLASSCANMITLTVYDYPVPVYRDTVQQLATGERITLRYKHLPPTEIEMHMITNFDAAGDRYNYDVQIDGLMSVKVGPNATFAGVVIRDVIGEANGYLHNRAKMNLSWVSEFDENGTFRRYLRSDMQDYQVVTGDGFWFSDENESGALFPQMQGNVGSGEILARFTRAPAFNLENPQSSAVCRLRGRVHVDNEPGYLCDIDGEISSFGQTGTVGGYVIFDQATGTVLSAEYVVTGPGRRFTKSLNSQKITFKRKT